MCFEVRACYAIDGLRLAKGGLQAKKDLSIDLIGGRVILIN